MYRFKRIIQNNLSKPEELSGNVRVFSSPGKFSLSFSFCCLPYLAMLSLLLKELDFSILTKTVLTSSEKFSLIKVESCRYITMSL